MRVFFAWCSRAKGEFQKRVTKYYLKSHVDETEIEDGWFSEEQMSTELSWSKNLFAITLANFIVYMEPLTIT